MTTREHPASEDVRTETDTQAKFERLAAEWKHETAHLSSLRNYLKI